jgi:hypothetical protein
MINLIKITRTSPELNHSYQFGVMSQSLDPCCPRSASSWRYIFWSS